MYLDYTPSDSYNKDQIQSNLEKTKDVSNCDRINIVINGVKNGG